MTTPTLSAAQKRTLQILSEQKGFGYGFGRSAHALMRMGLAKRKYAPVDGHLWRFAITARGRAALSGSRR